jgi:transcriptional regulator with XRE-family HTH domain
MSEFPKALRALRRRYFYKQLALAKECDCSPAHISWLESGKRCPSCAMLAKLKNAFVAANVTDGEIVQLLAHAKTAIIEHRFSDLKETP